MEEIVLANAALALLEVLLPKIQQLTNKGEISAEDQQALKDKYLSLKNRADGQFTGPEWNA